MNNEGDKVKKVKKINFFLSSFLKSKNLIFFQFISSSHLHLSPLILILENLYFF